MSDEPTGWHAHPLTVTILGFALTTGVLTYYEHLVSEREAMSAWKAQEQARIKADTAQAKEALSAITRAIQARALETDMVRSAIARGDATAIVPRKEIYDQVFRDWNLTMDYALFEMDDTMTLGLAAPNFLDWRLAVTRFVAWGQFRLADDCLTAAYDQSLANDFAPVQSVSEPACAQDWAEALREHTQAARACGSEVLVRGTEQLAQLQSIMLRRVADLKTIDLDWRAKLVLENDGAYGSYVTQAFEESQPVACALPE